MSLHRAGRMILSFLSHTGFPWKPARVFASPRATRIRTSFVFSVFAFPPSLSRGRAYRITDVTEGMDVCSRLSPASGSPGKTSSSYFWGREDESPSRQTLPNSPFISFSREALVRKLAWRGI